MYYYIEGIAALLGDGFAVIDCGGVGYRIGTSATALSKVCVGKKIRFYTVLNVREDAMELFGFPTEEEKKLFLLLTGITGVGPKAALAILSVTTPERLALGIMTGDEKLLTSAQGVGKKLASRIILELKDKIAKENGESATVESFAPVGTMPAVPAVRNSAVSALMVLGYSRQEAMAAVGTVADDIVQTDEIVRLALKNT